MVRATQYHHANRARAGRRRPGFITDEAGSMLMFGMIIFVIMLMVAGMGVDLIRYETNRARLQSTLDRAVLAAANLDQTGNTEEIKDVVVDYFTRSGLGDYVNRADIVVDQTFTSRRVSARAQMQTPTFFMKLMDINNLPTPAAGAAEESASRVEISLVVDVSGSMAWSSSSGRSKIAELRDAATEFVNIVQCNPDDPTSTTCTVEPDVVSINLIPYAEYVMAGERILDQMNVTNEHNISSCLYFPPEMYSEVALDLSLTYQRVAHFDPWWPWYSRPYGWACRTQTLSPIEPFENDPADLRSAISGLQAGSYTSIDMGVKWGAAMLDPAFRPVVQGLASAGEVIPEYAERPYDYTENGVKKVIVVMTDGYNTTQNYLYDGFRDGPSGVWYNAYYDEYSIYRASTDSYYWTGHGHFHDHPQGEYERGTAVELTFQELWQQVPLDWYRRWWWLPDPGSSDGHSTKNARLDEICTAAKARNITIYAVGFEVSSSSAAVMESCASSPAHFFEADGTNLSEAFAAIARQISALRLVN